LRKRKGKVQRKIRRQKQRRANLRPHLPKLKAITNKKARHGFCTGAWSRENLQPSYGIAPMKRK
jgi:hypothetical protein